jgi:hypothetical protein
MRSSGSAFDDVRHRGDGGATQLRLQSIPLGGWKRAPMPIHAQRERVSDAEADAYFAT